jgi:hypothetical protein
MSVRNYHYSLRNDPEIHSSPEEQCLAVSGKTELNHGVYGGQDLGCDGLRYNSYHSGT